MKRTARAPSIPLLPLVLGLALAGAPGAARAALPPAGLPAVSAAGRGNPWVNLRDGAVVPTTHADGAESAGLAAGAARPLSLATADFDADGVPDLASGFATDAGGALVVRRGNLDALHPNSPEARARRAAGGAVDAPFLPEARAFALPAAPDFLGAGDFDADGRFDLLLAATGDSALYFLPGDGKGGFGEAARIALPGFVTALAVGDVNRRDGLADAVVALRAPSGPRLAVFEGPGGARLAEPEFLTLPGEAGALALGEFDGAPEIDIAIAAGRRLLLVHGRDRALSLDAAARARVAPPALSTLRVPFEIVAMAAGNFVWDAGRERDLALLGGDGLLRHAVRARDGFALRPEANALRLGAPLPGARAPLLLRTKSSALPGDDLAILAPGSRQLRLVSADATAAPDAGRPAGSPRAPALLAALDTASEPAAALVMNLGVDALDDLVLLDADGATVALPTAPLATFSVTNINDSGAGSLRQAILNANATGGADLISFAIGSGAKTIIPLTPLPPLNEAVTIDGTTQPGFAGTPIIELNGSSAGVSANGLLLSAYGSTVRGLVVNRFNGYGIYMNNDTQSVTGNYIGTDFTGTIALGNGTAGIAVGFGYCTVGGTTGPARNLVSGNFRGVYLSGSVYTTIMGNYIGTGAAGGTALGNTNQGIWIVGAGASQNTVGGTTAGAGNLISANAKGIDLDSSGVNLVQGNFVGCNAGCTTSIGNTTGVSMTGNHDATLGGTTATARNVISGNSGTGVYLFGAARILVQGNYLGLNTAGTGAVANGGPGLFIDNSSPDAVVGGAFFGAGNAISGNSNAGIYVQNSPRAILQGNFIGTNAAGTLGVPNTGAGISVLGNTTGCQIGGTATYTHNVISGNGGWGIYIDTDPTTGQVIEGNSIGTDLNRVNSITNGAGGIWLARGVNHRVGGSVAAGNFIAANAGPGVQVSTAVLGATIQANGIYANSGLGIDLGGDGLTANDLGDADSGANGLLNFPTISAASASSGSGTTVAGAYNGRASANVTLEFFSSPACDPAGYGEGRSYLGSAVIATNAFGDASYSANLATAVPPGYSVTATATDPDGNTSEFSQCRAVAGPNLVFSSYLTDDSTGNNNGVLDLADCAQLFVRLKNGGSATATNISARLYSNTTGAVVGQPDSTWPNLAPGAIASNTVPFAVSVAAPAACGARVDLALRVTSTQGIFVIPFSITPGLITQGASGPVAIPDSTPAGIDLPLTVPAAAGTLTKVTASFHLTHTFDGDLVISLVHPDATSVALSNRFGGSYDNFGTDCAAGWNDTNVDDAAGAPLVSAVDPPFLGTWRPAAPLSNFNGKTPAGTWNLHVSDNAGADLGTIQCWSLSYATGSSCATGSGACVAPAGEPNPLIWTPGGKTALQWGAASNAIGYNVYQGGPGDLPNLLNGVGDSCLLAATTGLTSGPVALSTPATGSFYWYLVRAVGPVGEGAAGSGSAGPEIQDSTGFCP